MAAGASDRGQRLPATVTIQIVAVAVGDRRQWLPASVSIQIVAAGVGDRHPECGISNKEEAGAGWLTASASEQQKALIGESNC